MPGSAYLDACQLFLPVPLKHDRLPLQTQSDRQVPRIGVLKKKTINKLSFKQ